MFEKLKQKLKQVKERITKKIAPEPMGEETPEITAGTQPEALSVEEVKPEIKLEISAEERVRLEVPEKKPVVEVKRKVPEIEAERKPVGKVKAGVILPEKPKRGFIRAVKRVAGRELTAKDIDDILWELQVAMLESDVAVPVADQRVERVKMGLVGKRVGIRADLKKMADEVLSDAIKEVLRSEHEVDLIKIIKEKRAKGDPAVLVFVGINGHGKTTTIAKLARYLTKRGFKVVLAAGDTFRAAGIEQLEIHAKRLGVDIVKQRRGADSAAVAYDAIEHARARNLDVVLVDTAGRMQTDVNLMDEMKKIVRVAKPDAVIFVGDALTGNDAVEQARSFDQAVGITGTILCKMDADARGGAALSITQVTGKPILFLGTGQGYDDLVEFKPEIILNALFGD
ncbi:MAG: signal recognition particle-docking protein FtsY [Candidatus Hadarchaeum sp.]|uniref:signal recognition particle-docking protein FtsY n=1 Tax=Candidatus Hadarchaeum sp. TaxID=2883567 RepID=UPI003174245B